MQYRLSELIINHEDPYYRDEKRLKEDKEKRIREVQIGGRVRHLTWIDDAKNIESITTPEGRELTPEELFDFVIGDKITDLARTENTGETIADIAIVLGNIQLLTTRERAIKAFELYKKGFVKKIIFTGGITIKRDKKGYMHPETFDDFMNNDEVNWEWSDRTEADWGAETLVEGVFDEENYQEHLRKFVEELCVSMEINPEDILIEDRSTTTQENAEFCENIFNIEEVETGMQVCTAVLVTTCTHGNRAMRQFEKVFGDRIKLKWCPSTLDLEQYPTLNSILSASIFDAEAFRQELKRIYCTDPKLIQMLREEIGYNRNVFIRGEIDEPILVSKIPDFNSDILI